MKERVKQILADHLGKKVEELGDDQHLMNDLGADSLDLVEFVMAFEEEFNIEIADDSVENMPTFTVGDMVRLIEGLTQ